MMNEVSLEQTLGPDYEHIAAIADALEALEQRGVIGHDAVDRVINLVAEDIVAQLVKTGSLPEGVVLGDAPMPEDPST